MYEMEKVVEGLFGECTVEFTGDIVRECIRDMVATYQRHKQAAKSSNPLVQLVHNLVDEVLGDETLVAKSSLTASNKAVIGNVVAGGKHGMNLRGVSVPLRDWGNTNSTYKSG